MSAVTQVSRRRLALRYVRLVGVLTGASWRRLLAYPGDFFIGMAGFVVRVGLSVLIVVAIFGQVSTLAGWTLNESLLLVGVSMTVRGLDHCFTDQLWEMARKVVARGELVRYLIRPVNPLFTLLSERFLYPDGLGELIGGVVIVGVAVTRLDGDGVSLGGPLHVAGGIGLMLCGVAVYFALKLIFASMAFWTVTSLQAMDSMYQVSEAARFPLPVFPTGLQVVLVGVLPFAFTGYVPAEYLLHGTGMLSAVSPFATAGLVSLSLLIWRRGVNTFEAVGG